ncbi:MAG TPA: hypothetical protein VLE97_10260 [Gaiellaceae bacterium]|nr:hypothetical protein [Gaiellaceae bacterium]
MVTFKLSIDPFGGGDHTSPARTMDSVVDKPATIVVVDEQAAFLDLAEQALLGAGHRVLVTTAPAEVLEIAIRVEIDALVADGTFLERTDPALVRKLQLAQSGLRILYLSSLRMPFSLDAMVEGVTRLLATDSPPGRLRAAPRG